MRHAWLAVKDCGNRGVGQGIPSNVTYDVREDAPAGSILVHMRVALSVCDALGAVSSKTLSLTIR